MECTKCHRTGFDEDELAQHQAKKCYAISPAVLRNHLKFDDGRECDLTTPTEANPNDVTELKAELIRVNAIVEQLQQNRAPEGGLHSRSS